MISLRSGIAAYEDAGYEALPGWRQLLDTQLGTRP
jgi:hypothetical protein